MTFSYEDKSPQVNTRMSRSLKKRLDEYAEAHDVPRSKIVRDAVREYLPDDDRVGPNDPELYETWCWFRARADENGYVPSTDAINELSQRHSLKKAWIKHMKLRPLEREGWITPAHSKIVVHEQPINQLSDLTPQK